MDDWVSDVIDALGAWGVAALVALENVFPPIPSEIVLPLAGSVQVDGAGSYVLLVVAATIGSVVGAWVLYGFAAVVGEDRLHLLVRRYGRWISVDETELGRAEAWFDRRGTVAVLVGRCVPLIRSLVSLPAGVRRMPVVRFTVLSALGSAVWNASLIGAGVVLDENWERVGDAMGTFQLVVVAVVLVLVGLYARRRIHQRLDRDRSPDDR